MSFDRVIQENFNGAAGLCYNVDVNGNQQTIKILNRLADTSKDNPAVQNFDNVNTGLTSIYSPRNSAGEQLMLSLDVLTGNPLNRAPMDRYYWSGSLVTDTSTNVCKFTWANIDNGSSTFDTDGFLMVPEPYHDFTPGSTNTNRAETNQTSMRVNLQFNNLPAFTWVPLCGVINTHTGSAISQTTAVGTVYQSAYQEWYYSYPSAACTNSTNLYNQTAHMWSFGRNTISWFIYIHDGNGKGMVATCAGEVPTATPSEVPHYPTNEYFGDASKNGYLKWRAPDTLVKGIDDLVNDPTVNSNDVLQTFWETYGGNGESRADGKVGYEAEIRQWYKYWRDDANIAYSRAGISKCAYTFTSSTAPEYSLNSNGQYVDRNQGDGEIGYGPGGSTRSTEATRTFNAQRMTHTCEYWTGTGNAGVGYTRSRYPAAGGWNWNHGVLLAFGATTNADFSSAEDIYLNTTIVGTDQASTARIYDYGVDSTTQNAYSGNGNSSQACQMHYAGKILDFSFASIPQQTWYDNMQFTAFTGYRLNSTGHRYVNPSFGAGTTRQLGAGPTMLALRPTIVGDGQINNFAIGTYEQFSGDTNWTNNATLSAYVKPEPATLYNFPVLGFSFDPTVTASAGNASSFTDSTGATITSQLDPSWSNPQNLFDNDVTTRAEVLKEGESNALYIEMNGFLGTPVPSDTLEITGFTMNVRGVTQSAIYEHKLRFQIVKNDRSTVLFETADDTAEAANIQVPNDSSGIFPTQNGTYNMYFRSTTTNTVTYGDMKDAYIKVWAEELPRSYNFNVSAPDSTAYLMSGSDRTGNVTGNNPPIEIKQGDSITFIVNATGHPLHLKTAQTTGTGDQIPGVTNNGTDSGSVSYTFTSTNTYYYQCENHSSMTGTITVTT